MSDIPNGCCHEPANHAEHVAHTQRAEVTQIVTQYDVTVTLRPCPACAAPITVVNGRPQGPLTFWSDNGRPSVTPHTEDCVLRGTEQAE